MDPSPLKCSLCWGDGNCPPPYIWNKASAPNIPNKKGDLIKALSQTCDEKTLQSQGKEELRYMFRKVVRGERHPNDCTHKMSGMTGDELEDKVKAHGLSTSSGMSTTRGLLQTMLRAHWNEQCSLVSSSKDDIWEIIDESPRSKAFENYHKVEGQMVTALTRVFDHVSSNKAGPQMEKASKAYNDFIDAMNDLVSV